MKCNAYGFYPDVDVKIRKRIEMTIAVRLKLKMGQLALANELLRRFKKFRGF